MAAEFEVFRGANQGAKRFWYWRLRAANGEIVAQSEGYSTERDAQRGADATVRAALEVAAQRFDS